MTNLEQAVSKWLPGIWTPGVLERYPATGYQETRSDGSVKQTVTSWAERGRPCPQPTPELGFRLLEAMKCWAYWNTTLKEWLISSRPDEPYYQEADPDLLTAIIKAGAALADKDTE